MLHAKQISLAFAAIAVFFMGVAIATDREPRQPGAAPGSGPGSKELVEAARKTYEEMVALRPLNPDASRIEDICAWSKRWRDAEWNFSSQVGQKAQGAKAIMDHFDRMTELEKKMLALHKQRAVGEAETAAATYYRIEAELMVARAAD